MKVIEIKIKKTMTHAEGNKLVPLVKELKTGEALQIPIVVGKNPMGKIEFYSEEKLPEKAIGFLDKNQDEAMEIIEEILDDRATYKCYLCGIEGTTFLAKLKYENVVEEVVEVSIGEFDSIISDIVNRGICSKERVEENIKIMQSHKCPDEMIRQVLLSYRKYEKPVKVPKTVYVDADPKSAGQSIFSQCLLNTLIGSPTIYEGDKSVGKNVCAETVALVRNQPYYIISFNRNMIADDIFGTKTTDNSAAGELTLERAGAHLRVMADGWDKVDDKTRKLAEEFEMYSAKAASVSIVQELSQYVDWVKDGGVMCFNGARCW